MLVKVAFVIGERSSLVVPADSLVYRGEVVGVYVVGEDDRVSFRYVRAGAPTPDNMTEILSGLDEGERIAADPALATGRARGQSAQGTPDEASPGARRRCSWTTNSPRSSPWFYY